MNNHVKVLMIEDHPIVRDGCQRIFSRRTNIEMKEAGSASVGINVNRDFKPDVIVLDIGLPDANGFDIIDKLLATTLAPRSLYSACTRHRNSSRVP